MTKRPSDIPPRRSSMPPASQDPREHNRKLRQSATIRQRALQGEDVEHLSTIVDSMSTTITNLRDTSLRPAADKVLHSSAYITEILELNTSIEEVLKQIQFILSLFASPYDMNNKTGKAALISRNIESLQSRIQMAQRSLSDILPANKEHKETRTLFEPDDRIVRLMQEMNQRPGLFINANPRAISEVMNVLNDYLRSFIEATKLGVYATIQTTSHKLVQLGVASQKVEKQQQEAEAFGLASHPEVKRNWIEILHAVEFTLANLYVRLTEIYGPSAAWLLSQVEVVALKKFFRELHEDEKRLKSELAGKNEINDGAFARMKEALSKMMKTRQEPPRTRAEIEKELNKKKGHKRYLRPYIEERTRKD